ncbi:hypothetical protein NDU88_000048 [Pleurodeles waltl]|uniref:Sialate O-acetylesterase domain-containing protein n=1 Tax=Pleurodeles waltl TaxID=8319 RepID=A0AAV7TEN0_PLEWA|nr:hypothetical protein NDU88_000048 [Pleurodeles waltl]
MAGYLCFFIFMSSVLPFTDASFDFASYYADHMVLQMAPAKAIIWGYGDVGAFVTVSIYKDYNGLMKKTVQVGGNADIWKVALDPVDHGGPYVLYAEQFFRGGVTSITLQDIYFGDVWLCGGQSNMEMTVLQVFNSTKELAEAYLYPHVRLFTASLVQARVELYDLDKVDLQWSVPTPETLGQGQFTYFSAVCWLFGRNLYDILKYPIGLVESCWGGTPVEAWSSARSLEKCGLSIHIERQKRNTSYYDYSYYGPEVYSVLWNAMIHPLLNMTMKGVIWYQGEANTNLNTELYNCTFPAMIEDWRTSFHEGSEGQTDRYFPFGFVQLSTNQKSESNDNFPIIRWHQTADFGYAPNSRMRNTFMAVAIDLCDETSPYGWCVCVGLVSLRRQAPVRVAAAVVLDCLPLLVKAKCVNGDGKGCKLHTERSGGIVDLELAGHVMRVTALTSVDRQVGLAVERVAFVRSLHCAGRLCVMQRWRKRSY